MYRGNMSRTQDKYQEQGILIKHGKEDVENDREDDGDGNAVVLSNTCHLFD